jgi:hypothetical protein
MSSVMVRSPQVVRERERALRCAPSRREKALAGGTRDTKQNRFQIEIVPADGTTCCLLYGLRYVTVFYAASKPKINRPLKLSLFLLQRERRVLMWWTVPAPGIGVP